MLFNKQLIAEPSERLLKPSPDPRKNEGLFLPFLNLEFELNL